MYNARTMSTFWRFALLTGVVLLVSCSRGPDPTATPTSIPGGSPTVARIIPTPVPTSTVVPTPQAQLRPTPEPTATAAALATPAPTATPAASATPARAPVYSGIADIVFFNGDVITMEPDAPLESAVAINGETIVYVGNSDEVMSFVGPETRLIDLNGKALLPGFVDPHNHVMKPPYEEAQQRLTEVGTTTFGSPGVREDRLEDLLAFETANGFRVRTNLYLGYNTACGELHPQDWYLAYPPVTDTAAMLRIPGIKIFTDGGSCNSLAVSFPAENPGGDLYLSSEELATLIEELQNAWYQAAIHTLGDRAVGTALDALETVLAGGPNTFRHRMEHNRLIRPDQIPRYGDVGVVPVVFGQPYTCKTLDGGGWSGLLKDDSPAAGLRPWFDPWRSLFDNKPDLRVAWHSDGPNFFTLDPLIHLASLVTRDEFRTDGSFCEAPDWLAAGGIEVEQALRMMTINAAYALHMDDVVGSLKPGKFADLVILSDNPMKVDPDELVNLNLLMTMVGGRVEHCADESVCSAVQRQETVAITPPDVIFHNGNLITIETDMPSAEALAVFGEAIVHVGTNEETLALAGPETQLIDLGGRALLPGFVDPHIHPYDLASPETVEESQQYVLEGGVTTIGDAFVSPAKMGQYLAAVELTELRIRTNLYLAYNHKCTGPYEDDWFLDHPREIAPNLRFAGVKLIGDPAGPNNTCGWALMSTLLPGWLVELKGSGPYGELSLTEEELTQLFTKYQDLDFQVIIHVRGDGTLDAALNAIENALDGGPNVYRHRIEHNDFIRPDQYSRYGEIGVLPTIRGRPFACLAIDTFGGFSGFGAEATPWYRIGRSLIEANPDLPIAWHSDVAAFSRRPVQDLYDWVTRKQVRRDGTICEPPDWLAAEAISVEQALRIMTINGAYQMFMEDEVGSLKAGKLADMIILSDNPLTVDPDSLKDLEILMTMVGGRVEHCGQDDLCPVPPG
ncbi:MAG: amidohydrolase family protein [Chloroflexi bacterium]|nr:amidohydrolase family protein [Chloroflexota bacterium]